MSPYKIVSTADQEESAAVAANLAGRGKVGALMKGMHTDQFMHAVLQRENCLRTSRLLSHCMLIAAPAYSREETSKYTDLMPDGTSRGFTWLIDAKSVITFPCPEKPLDGPGLYEIRGLAWTGNGKVKRVDVSMDGGINWQSARLHEAFADTE